MLHGLGSSSAGYRAQLHGLAGERRIIAWNAPGFGASTRLAVARPGLAAYVDSAIALLDALGEDRVDVMGSSWGAMIAAGLAALHPDRVRSLVLAAPTTGYFGLPEVEKRNQITARVNALHSPDTDAKVQRFLGPAPTPLTIQRFLELRADTTPEGFAQATEALYQTDVMGLYARISTPTLILAGSADRVVSVEKTREIAATIQRSRLEFLHCGHILKIEQPAEVNRLVSAFWQSTGSPA